MSPAGLRTPLARELAAAMQPAIGAPDGHTLFVGASGIMSINPHLMRNLSYDPMRDFAPLTIAISAPNVLVANPAFAPHDVPSLIALAEGHPNKASYGTSGIGSSEHLTMELFAQRTGTTLTHVPYGGSAAAVTDLIAGTTELSFLNISAVSAHLQSGSLRAIAIGSLVRHPLFPAVPTVDGKRRAGLRGRQLAQHRRPAGDAGAYPRHHPCGADRGPAAAGKQGATDPDRLQHDRQQPGRLRRPAERELGEWREVVKAAGLGAQ